MARTLPLGLGNTLGPALPSLRQINRSLRNGEGRETASGVSMLRGRPYAISQTEATKFGAAKNDQETEDKELSSVFSSNTTSPTLNGSRPSDSNSRPANLPAETPLAPGTEPGDSTESTTDGWVASAGVATVVAVVVGLGLVFKNDIKHFLDVFSNEVEMWGPWGYVAYGGLYTILELLALPATPLTLTAGYLFGSLPGTAVVSVSATTAAVGSFLISRYALRDRIRKFVDGNKRFVAIDEAIKRDGFKFVFLLRLSPLFPFAASNYLYGLTSVELGPYTLASWLGMLPGTWAYVSAGNVGRTLSDSGPTGVFTWELGVGVLVTLGVIFFVGNLAKNALAEVEEESSAN